MSQVTAFSPKHPSNKNKILAAFGAVIIGHVGVLFVLSNIQTSQLKPITPPKPIQVRLVEPPKPKVEPPKPIQPPKPKEVKIQETPPPPPPKKVEKIEQVKKEVVKPKAVEPPKPAKVETPVPVVTPVVAVETPKPVVTPTPKPITTPAPTPAPVVESVPVADPAPVKPAVDMTPRNLGDGAGVSWKRKPKPKINAVDLEKVTNDVIVLRIDVDASGKIKARVVQSSGSDKVDREMVRAVQAAQFQPYKDNGVAVPFFAEQPFRVQ